MNYCSDVRVPVEPPWVTVITPGHLCNDREILWWHWYPSVTTLSHSGFSVALGFLWIVLCNNTVSRKGTCCKFHENNYLYKRQLSRLTESCCSCCCLFGFNVAFNNFSVISRRFLVATGSSMLTFIVLPHWSIMPKTLDTLDMIPHPITLFWHWVDQS